MTTKKSEVPSGNREIVYRSRKPAGHVPAIQRYSARAENQAPKAALFVGAQGSDLPTIEREGFVSWISEIAQSCGGVESHDVAWFTDVDGMLNVVAALYWSEASAFQKWQTWSAVRRWWDRPEATTGPIGTWWEPVVVPHDRLETISFREYIRGISACPALSLQPMSESGYWGAARDRVPLSPYDLLSPSDDKLVALKKPRESKGVPIRIQPPKNLAVIRSGVSWETCGAEQLRDFETMLRPKLDAGMDYLRKNPFETGCCSLRQVNLVDANGSDLKEAYSLGHFVSLAHLERWASSHPTHLAIYARAMADRKRYGDGLELLTYHEVYVLDGDNPPFEYVNCHPSTGILPYFA
jgi:aldoxime dehydratase